MTTTIHAALPAVRVAADNDLYRVCGSDYVHGNGPVVFRTKAGATVDTRSVLVAVAGGLLGKFADRETLPDGTLAERLDLSEGGLDWLLAQD